MERVYNFSPGPSQLALPVLEKAQKDLVCYGDTGMSVMEMSHRSKMYTDIYDKTVADLRHLRIMTWCSCRAALPSSSLLFR